jgi:hypothetical protein
MFIRLISISAVALFVVTGCGKKQAPPPPKPEAATAAAEAAQKPLDGTVDPTMTTALKAFVQEKRRLPQNMLELKSTKLDSVPRAPAGFMYAIDPVTVEVKLVKVQ